jgi:hypothetical protein
METYTHNNGQEVQLPDDLRKEATLALKKVGAYMGSNGNTAVMESFKETPEPIVLVGISFVLGLVAYIVSELSNYYEIRRNWTYYRCQPSITPFSKFYGHDLEETMNFCIGQAVKEHAPGVIDPIYAGIDRVAGVVDGVYGKAEAIEGGVSHLLGGFESFVLEFANSFRLVGTRMRMSVIRIKDIFARVYGTFIAFAYAAISAITFGENLVCNPLVTFVAGIAGVDICCFHPDTRIVMADGFSRIIRHIHIGDTLRGGGVVTSTYLFDGTDVSMVFLHGIHVSSNHYVERPDGLPGMIQAGEHPSAERAPSLSRLWCIGTSNHRIPILSTSRADFVNRSPSLPSSHTLLFADYEESSDPDVIEEAQYQVELALNGPSQIGPRVENYCLGLDPSFEVLMLNDSWKKLSDVRIEDELAHGGKVRGLIREVCEEVCKTPAGAYVSSAQLFLQNKKWKRAAHLWPIEKRTTILYHLMLSNNTGFIISKGGMLYGIRDYAEWSSSATQAPYDNAIKLNTAPGSRVQHAIRHSTTLAAPTR